MWAVLTALLASWTPPPLSDAVVRIETQPPGAVVLLDGHLHCRSTPCVRFVAPGTYVVTALHEDGVTTRQTLLVTLPAVQLQIELVAR